MRTDGQFRKWIAFSSVKGEVELEEGAFLYSEYAHPFLEIVKYRQTLNHWTNEVANLLNMDCSENKLFQIVLDYFFKTLAFTGNRDNYHNPQNSYLPASSKAKRACQLPFP
jgi:regulator of sirC expression with transglutaminase-like and TPR domain